MYEALKKNGRVVGIKEFKDLILKIANAKPDYTYNEPGGFGPKPCYYAPSVRYNGSTSRCLIGEALHQLGFETDGMDNDNMLIGGASSVLPALGFDDEVTAYARDVQKLQDTGTPWGEAACR